MKDRAPDWEMVADLLIRDIRGGRYKKDEKLPSENEMAARFSLPRADIRRVYGRLKELGCVYAMQGCGSFFAGVRDLIPLKMSGGSFSKKMREMGLICESKNVEARPIRYNPLIYEPLGLGAEERVWKVVRLRVLGREPAAVHISFLPEKEFPSLPWDAREITSMADYFEKAGREECEIRDTQMRVSLLSPGERKMLGVQGPAQGLTLTARQFAPDGETVLELQRTVYRSDRFIFLL
jgi:DNA-binding GntR family transcriptional regulator